MTLIHLDAVGGIAGDMFVAALLDAFPDLKPRVLADATAVLPPGVGKPYLEEGHSLAIRALRFGLAEGGVPATHAHDHDHGGASTFSAMAARLRAAPLAPGTADRAVAILTILAGTEAAIHGVALDQVHFHEIGDWDSSLDVVAAGSIAAALPEARWTVSPLPRGDGLVKTRHGLLPVPAPATAAILQGFDWRDDGIGGERVTPTGAAILKHLVGEGHNRAPGRLLRSGYGAGTRALAGIPNVLRALVFDDAQGLGRDWITVISFEIDDMTGEEVGVAAERLRAEAGVLDLSIGQRWGKKGRPVQSFRLLAKPEAALAIVDRCFGETSTIGLRIHEQSRVVLRREAVTVNGIGVKSVVRPGTVRTVKAEIDAVAGDTLAERRARKNDVEDKA